MVRVFMTVDCLADNLEEVIDFMNLTGEHIGVAGEHAAEYCQAVMIPVEDYKVLIETFHDVRDAEDIEEAIEVANEDRPEEDMESEDL
jgi:PHD/YefM family antitoxin component YafN of YafNO toxin-antitoxin module